ncbi:MAG: TonB family protein [Verrucomicrobia bacterium]|nr:TonB family protein [Verrucomicrobiota bacterium]
MNRLQRKCLLASAALHGLLLLVLLVGPAFFVARQKPANDLPVLDYIPFKVIDEAMFGGGTPKAVLPPATEQPPAAQPPAPVPPRPVVTPPQDSKPPPKKPADAKATDTKSKPPSSKRSIDLDLKDRVTRKSPGKTASKESRAKADAKDDARQAAAAWQSLVKSAQQNLQQNLKPGTVIDVPGPGGEAYANYGQVIKSIYERAWHKPSEAADDSAEVEVEVTIWRDGTVIRSRIVDRSGNTVLDKSVQSVLDRVRTVPPFPEGAKDDERTFNITFRLKNNRLLG